MLSNRIAIWLAVPLIIGCQPGGTPGASDADEEQLSDSVVEELAAFELADHQSIRIQRTDGATVRPGDAVRALQANCNANERAIGGGIQVHPDDRETSSLRIQESYPSRRAWHAVVRNRAGASQSAARVDVFAVCLGSETSNATLSDYDAIVYEDMPFTVSPGAVAEQQVNCPDNSIPISGGVQLESDTSEASIRMQESFPSFTQGVSTHWNSFTRNVSGLTRPDADGVSHAVCFTQSFGGDLDIFDIVRFHQEDVEVVSGNGVAHETLSCPGLSIAIAGGVQLLPGSTASLRLRESYPLTFPGYDWTFDLMNRAGAGNDAAIVRLTVVCLERLEP